MILSQSIKSQSLKMGSIFADHMVLQQKTKAPVWGTAKPGSEINIIASWDAKTKAVADDKGNWITTIKTPEAGGPYTLSVKTSAKSIEIKDVLIGEVWLCSGQSNMEMPLMGWPPKDTIMGSAKEISNANNSQLRTFTVKRGYSLTPEKDCNGEWTLFNKEHAGQFSATAYFFGKRLYEELKVPIGLLHTSWGGTPIESWTDGQTLQQIPEFIEYFVNLKKLSLEYDNFIIWVNKHDKVKLPASPEEEKWKNLDLKDSACSAVNYSDLNWKTMTLPCYIEKTELGAFDGAVWYRRNISFTEDYTGKELEISLGPIDDMDVVYFNGTRIGGTEKTGAYQKDRIYSIPANIIHKGINTIAIRIIDNQGGGGIYGKMGKMFIRDKQNDSIKMNIAGEWKYLPVAEYLNDEFYIYPHENMEGYNRPNGSSAANAYQPAALFNAMIAPLVPYAIKGFIWYQGEANVGNAELYSRMFPAMINGWRQSWAEEELPFYYVQIAPYIYSGENNIESAWIRDAQRRTLSVKNTGMAVTLDIGNVYNIHPINKADVGQRLALWALAKDYKKNIKYSGPLFEKVSFEGSKAIVTFTNAESGLKIKEGMPNEFEIAGEDGVYYPAEYSIAKNTVMLSSSSVLKPAKVKYAFKNGSQGILFNNEGLPASSFTSESKIE